MKPVALAFVLLLGYAHIQGDLDEAVRRPLSMFRENGNAWVGYWLFALLLTAGVLLLWQLIRMRWFLDAACPWQSCRRQRHEGEQRGNSDHGAQA